MGRRSQRALRTRDTGRSADVGQRIGASGRADRNRTRAVEFEVRLHIRHDWRGARGFALLLGPLLGSTIELAHVIDTGIHLRIGARPNKIRDSDGSQ
jgi:hypothetical protein